ncbi:MAG: Maf family protein [Planctomycetota bacterium]
MSPATQSLILASASPRRYELLKQIMPRFQIKACPLAEPSSKPDAVNAVAWAEALAYFKARAVADRHPGNWVLGADTVVVCEQMLLGKPLNVDDARRMLLLQAGRACDVITGLCFVRVNGGTQRLFHAALTRVWMRADQAQIETYLRSGDWSGKAGAYGIQDVGDRLVERIEGSFSNVVGLPLEAVTRLLKHLSLTA